MRRTNSLLGIIGLILLLFAAVAAAFTGWSTSVDKAYIAINAGLGLFALVTYLSTGLENIREAVDQRSTKYGVNVVVGSLIFLVVLCLLNFISFRNHKRFDLTEQGVYSLSDQSKQVVAKLTKDLNIQAFVEGGANPDLRDLLDTYKYNSDKFHYEMIDPDRDPEQAQRYNIRAYNSVRFSYGDESSVITEPTEENITNAIIKVTRDTQKTVCVVDGHGEVSIDDTSARGGSALKAALEAENYKVEKLLLASVESVPDTCSLIADVGPQRPYQESELAAVKKYLANGGRGLFLVSPRSANELKPLFAEYGIAVDDNIVVDQVVRLFQGPTLGLSPLVSQYGAHEITDNFRQMTMFPMSRAVRADTQGKTELKATELAKSSESSWAETDLDALFNRSQASMDEGTDKKGPISLAVASSKESGEGDRKVVTRLVVIGSADFAENRQIDGTYYNRDLLLNAAGWLAGQADLMSIRPRGIRASRAQFTNEEVTVIFYLSVLLIPQVLLLAGVAVWWRRE